MPSNSTVAPTDPAVEAELDRLAVMPIVQLRTRYRELFRRDPPEAFGPDLLRRSIAHRIQEKAYGGLSRSTKRLLDQMMKAAAARPDGKVVLPRKIKPGSVLVRTWKGKSHRVTVVADGFIYDSRTYPSLSEIAVLITGTRWNGPRFFGLRSKAQDGGATVDAGPRKGGARKPDVARPLSSHLGGGSDYRKRNAAVAGKSAPAGVRHGR